MVKVIEPIEIIPDRATWEKLSVACEPGYLNLLQEMYANKQCGVFLWSDPILLGVLSVIPDENALWIIVSVGKQGERLIYWSFVTASRFRYSRIVFWSFRPGMERFIKKFGFYPVEYGEKETKYERVIL